MLSDLKYSTKEIAEYLFPDILTKDDNTKNKLYYAVSYALSSLAKKSDLTNIYSETNTGFRGNYWYYKPKTDENIK